jgi:hypothetical protein
MPEAKLEVVAVMDGMLPATRGGLLITVADCGAKDDWVAIEEVEFDRVGEEGWPEVVIVSGLGGGDGAIDMGLEGVRWWWRPWLLLLLGKGGAILEVGVGIGVFKADKEVVCTGLLGSGM